MPWPRSDRGRDMKITPTKTVLLALGLVLLGAVVIATFAGIGAGIALLFGAIF